MHWKVHFITLQLVEWWHKKYGVTICDKYGGNQSNRVSQFCLNGGLLHVYKCVKLKFILSDVDKCFGTRDGRTQLIDKILYIILDWRWLPGTSLIKYIIEFNYRNACICLSLNSIESNRTTKRKICFKESKFNGWNKIYVVVFKIHIQLEFCVKFGRVPIFDGIFSCFKPWFICVHSYSGIRSVILRYAVVVFVVVVTHS